MRCDDRTRGEVRRRHQRRSAAAAAAFATMSTSRSRMTPNEAVAAHGEGEELWLLGARTGRRSWPSASIMRTASARWSPNGPIRRGPAVGVDAECAGDAEVAVRLHDLRRKADGTQRLDNLAPAGACPRAIDLTGWIRLPPAGIQRNGRAVADEALTPHRVARPADRDRASRRGGILQFAAKAFDEARFGQPAAASCGAQVWRPCVTRRSARSARMRRLPRRQAPQRPRPRPRDP